MTMTRWEKCDILHKSFSSGKEQLADTKNGFYSIHSQKSIKKK